MMKNDADLIRFCYEVFFVKLENAHFLKNHFLFTVLMVIEYAIPLTIISFVYIRMGIKLWLTNTPGNAHDQRDERILINKKKFIKMLSLVVLLFGICWLPWHILSVAMMWHSVQM